MVLHPSEVGNHNPHKPTTLKGFRPFPSYLSISPLSVSLLVVSALFTFMVYAWNNFFCFFFGFFTHSPSLCRLIWFLSCLFYFVLGERWFNIWNNTFCNVGEEGRDKTLIGCRLICFWQLTHELIRVPFFFIPRLGGAADFILPSTFSTTFYVVLRNVDDDRDSVQYGGWMSK